MCVADTADPAVTNDKGETALHCAMEGDGGDEVIAQIAKTLLQKRYGTA